MVGTLKSVSRSAGVYSSSCAFVLLEHTFRSNILDRANISLGAIVSKNDERIIIVG